MRVETNPLILTYHSICEGRSPLRISPSLFAEQMEWLGRNAQVVPLAELVEALSRRESLPPKTVALTFDDGFRDFYTDGAPVLRRFGFAATVFLPTAYCGQTNRWPGQPKWVDEQPLLDWRQIVELAGQGIAFGSHSVTHRDLTELPEREAEHEILGSKREIEMNVGGQAEFFCYPYGRWNGTVRKLVARHYAGACSTAAGIVDPRADPFTLPRVDAHYIRHRGLFRILFTDYFRAYLTGRRLVRRIRGQPEGFYSRL
jgi:peptidoglycan/xylan/chitin deacetylase (PgdA/CDA1 family)